MCKRVLIVMVVLVVMITVSGCQASKGIFDDVSGTAAWCSEKLEKHADAAAERDADRMARKLERNQAILSARLRLVQTEVQ